MTSTVPNAPQDEPDHTADKAPGAAPRKARDYAAEYARRQELARERGLASYWRERAALYPRPPRPTKPPKPVDSRTTQQRRDDNARAEGFESYWHKRKAQVRDKRAREQHERDTPPLSGAA